MSQMTVAQMLAGRAALDADIRQAVTDAHAKITAAKDAGFFPDGMPPFLNQADANITALMNLAPLYPLPVAE